MLRRERAEVKMRRRVEIIAVVSREGQRPDRLGSFEISPHLEIEDELYVVFFLDRAVALPHRVVDCLSGLLRDVKVVAQSRLSLAEDVELGLTEIRGRERVKRRGHDIFGRCLAFIVGAARDRRVSLTAGDEKRGQKRDGKNAFFHRIILCFEIKNF